MLLLVVVVVVVVTVVDEEALGKLVELVDWLLDVFESALLAESFSLSFSLLFLVFLAGVIAGLVVVFAGVIGVDCDATFC